MTIAEIFDTPWGLNPPKEALEADPNLPLHGSMSIDKENAFFKVWSHDWEQAHIATTAGGDEKHWRAEPSLSGNQAFHQGLVELEDGSEIEVGVIPLFGGHADKYATAQEAQRHYDKSENVRLFGRAHDLQQGCQIAGCIMPGTTVDEVGLMRLLGLSGDWRWFPQLASLDYIGPVFVPRQGLPKGVSKQHLQSVAASASFAVPLFQDRKKYEATYAEDGDHPISVVASIDTVAISPFIPDLGDNSMPEKIAPGDNLRNRLAVTADGEADTDKINELTQKLDALQESISLHDQILQALQAEVSTIDEVEAETPPS